MLTIRAQPYREAFNASKILSMTIFPLKAELIAVSISVAIVVAITIAVIAIAVITVSIAIIAVTII